MISTIVRTEIFHVVNYNMPISCTYNAVSFMSDILSMDQRSEEDIKRLFITPALEKTWDRNSITMETKITDGKIVISKGKSVRQKPMKADYILYYKRNYPMAVVEAKSRRFLPSYGLQQAKEYAKKLDAPFAYSSNGERFVEYDFMTGQERELSLEEFPSREELIERYKKEYDRNYLKGGDEDLFEGVSIAETDIVDEPFYTDDSGKEPRYYQRIAINRVLDAIAAGQQRLLLVMATGTGKTYTAFQIIWRLIKSGKRKRILYLADRNILVDQSISNDFNPLEKVIHKVDVDKEDPATTTSYQVYFALYQQLMGQNNEKYYEKLFNKDFFDFIVVDECHRGSAKEDSTWREILTYFSSATQLGMTATPKETSEASNTTYFSWPVYQYSLNDGIEDGFLAPFKVINITLNISDGWRPKKGQLDIYGNEIADRIYYNNDFDYNLILQGRISEVASTITQYMKETDRMGKTIVFCANEDAAERMRQALVQCNEDMCKKNGDYVVRITGSDAYGKSKLDYFIKKSSPYPVIATTSELLSTGVDCQMVKLIVLDKVIGSMTEFKQIIGRGTRLVEKQGKTFFAVIDLRNVSHLFADPSWDGPVEVDSRFATKDPYDTDPADKKNKDGNDKQDLPDPDGPEKPLKYTVDKDGCRVSVINKVVSVYDAQGKLLRTEDIVDYTKKTIKGQYPSLESLISQWGDKDTRNKIRQIVRDLGLDLEELKFQENMQDVDDLDFLSYIAFQKKAVTRKERVKMVKESPFLEKYSGLAREIIEKLLDKYSEYGVDEIDSNSVLKLSPFSDFGTPIYIAKLFGGTKQYRQAVRELKQQIYQVI